MHQHGRVVPQPHPVWIVRGDRGGPGGAFVGVQSADPLFMDFAMSISKGKAAGVVMKIGRPVHPLRHCRADPESGVIDASGAFIQGEEDLGSTDSIEVCGFAKGCIRLVAMVRPMAIQSRSIH